VGLAEPSAGLLRIAAALGQGGTQLEHLGGARLAAAQAFAAGVGRLACALAHESRLDKAGEASAALTERYPGLIAEDYAKMAGSFAPDREWGDLMERAMLRAAEAAANAEASA